MIKVICDRCGKEIAAPGKTGYLAWNFREGHGGDLIGNNVLEDRDYCDKCMGTNFDFIDRKPEKTDPAETGTIDMISSGGQEENVPETGDSFRKKGESIPEIMQSDPETAAGETEITEGTRDSSGSSAGKKGIRQQTGKPRRNSVDIGKIMALRDAGWSINKIADDMGLSKQSVWNAISRWKKAQEEQAQ